jgi:hypothetical protein
MKIKNKQVFLEKEVKIKAIFEFISDGFVYKNNTGRIKISDTGYFTYLIKNKDKWQNVKGELLKFKVIEEKMKGVGYTKKNVLKVI